MQWLFWVVYQNKKGSETSLFKIILDQALKQWLTGRKWRESGNTKIWISRKRRELLRWNKKHLSYFLKGYHLVKTKNFLKYSRHKSPNILIIIGNVSHYLILFLTIKATFLYLFLFLGFCNCQSCKCGQLSQKWSKP